METELLRDDTIHSRSASMNYSKIVSSQEIINRKALKKLEDVLAD